MDEGREYELKFDIGPHDIAHLQATVGPPEASRRLVSTYFDTEDGRLRGKKVALRIRRAPDGLVQTLKRTGASIVDREEWEHESPLLVPDLDWLRRTPLKRLFKASVSSGLKPHFTVDVHRSLFTLTRDGAEIEGALDRGAIIANGCSMAVHEFELELKAGRPKALLALAREMAKDVPLVLSLASKSDRGYAIAADTWGQPTKAMSLALRSGMTRAEAFQAIVQACLHLVLINAALLGTQDDSRDPGHVEAVHRARVALRRLRAALQLFAPVLRRRWRKTLRDDVEWMSDRFGAARDADVFLAEVTAATHPDTDEGAQDLIDLMVERRKHARLELRQALASPRWRSACLDLVEASETGVRRSQRDKGFRRLAARQFAVRLRRLAGQVRGLEGMSEEAQHDVRKKAKMLRYGLDFLGETPGLVIHKKRFARLHGDLKILQRTLGSIHDDAALRRHLRDDVAPHARSRAGGTGAAHLAAREPLDREVMRKAAKAARRVRRSQAFE